MKYIINCLLTLGILLCINDSQGFAQNKYATEIYGNIGLPKGMAKVVILTTPDFFNQEVYSANIANDGAYRVQFQKYYAGMVFLKLGENTHQVYVKPGEKLQVNVKVNETNKGKVSFLGESPSTSLNQTIVQWKNYQPRPQPYSKWMKDLSFAQLQDSVTRYTRSELKRLQQFCLSSQCSTEFLQWARSYILYNEANQLMRFRWYQPYANSQSPLKVIPKGYNYRFTYKFTMDQPRALKTLPYRDYIHEHNMHWHYVAYSKKMLNPEKIDREKELNWLLKNTNKGFARDLILAENYGALVQSGNETLIKKLKPLFLKHIQFVPARDYINSLD